MTGAEYQKLAARTINKDLNVLEREYHSLHGMVAEVGEIHSLYQKRYQGHNPIGIEHLMKECGDLLWFIAEFVGTYNYTMDDIMQMNIDKLKERYPDGFDMEKSRHRAEGDI